MRLARALTGVGLTIGMTVAVAALSRVPLDGVGADAALLRLSWKIPGEVVETCRERTPEELESLPVHMRTPDACEGRATAYRLEVMVDGRTRLQRRIEPGGLRGDRPLTVFEELHLEPGRHDLRAVFGPVEPGAAREPLVFEGMVEPGPGDVVLLSLDEERGRLGVRP